MTTLTTFTARLIRHHLKMVPAMVTGMVVLGPSRPDEIHRERSM